MNRETPLDLFRTACGLDAPASLAVRSASSTDGAPSTIDSPSPYLMIGRSPKNELVLADDRVSRRHAYLQAVAGGVVGIDLKSRTQTFWDDEPEPRPWGWLCPGHSVRIGPYRIERTDPQPARIPELDRLDPFASPEDQGIVAPPIPRAAFELPFRVGGVASTWEVPGLLAVVGRDDHCQLVLDDDSISRSHACLVRTPMGTWVVDLEAREGLFVNGTRVRWAWLSDGDTVRFGLFTIVVRYDRPPEGIGRDDVPLEAGASPSGPTAGGRGDIPPSGLQGRGLALRPAARPPGLAKAPGSPPPGSRSTESAIAHRGEWEPDLGMGPSPYAIWQQQMQLMESFHNDMMMMVQMFVAMHREFQTSVREELRRVQKLTQELSRLNARLLEAPEATGTVPKPEASRPGAPAREKRPAPAPTAPPRQADPGDAANGSGSRSKRPAPGPTDRPAPKPEAREDAGQAPKPPRESAEMYADITRRITELQRQRRGYWQRILKAING